MKYVECKVLRPSGVDSIHPYWSVYNNDTVYLFPSGTKEEDIEKLPEDIRKKAFIMVCGYTTGEKWAYKWKHRTCQGTGCVAARMSFSKDYEDVVGDGRPVDLAE